jgi:hypothetical protein
MAVAGSFQMSGLPVHDVPVVVIDLEYAAPFPCWNANQYRPPVSSYATLGVSYISQH